MTEVSRLPRVSIIIPVKTAESTLPGQLEALAAQDYSGEYEVIVADNGSSDGTIRVAENFTSAFSSFKVVDARDRRGSAYARSRGSEVATGDLFLYCDADDVVQPGWIDAMVAAAADGELIAGLPRWDLLNAPESERRWLGFEGQHGFLPFATGAALGVARAALEAVGGWDPGFDISGSDTDLSWRLQLAGYRYAFAPGAVVQKRDRQTNSAYAGQHFSRGLGSAQLHAKFKSRGMPGSNPWNAVKTWVWVVVNSPLALVDEARRAEWIRKAALAGGRLVGSLRFRTMYL